MIFIGLKRGTGFYAWLIRLWTRSEYSHVGIVYLFDMRLKSDVEQLTEAHETMLCFMFEATAKDGVIERETTIGDLADEGYRLYKANVSRFHREAVVGRLRRHVGDKYDWWAIFFSRIIPLNIQHRKQWYCFEYAAWALGMEKAWRWTGRTFEKFLKI